MRDWQSVSHVKWERKYHVVWVPEYRHKVIVEESSEEGWEGDTGALSAT